MTEETKQYLIESGIDVTAALELMMGSEKMLEKFLFRFPSDPTFPQLFEAIEKESKDEARIAAHSLKSVTGTLGFTELNRQIKDQEKAFKEGRWEEGVALLPQIRSEFERICTVIKEVSSN